MQEYLLSTGEVVYEHDLRARFPNVIFPLVITQNDVSNVNVKLVIAVPKPSPAYNIQIYRDGVEEISGEVYQKWGAVTLNSQEIENKLNTDKKTALIQINNDDNKIYADVIGNKTTEYLKAAEDARAFKAAGYPANDVPDYVQSWAEAKLWTATQACDDIINQELLWQGAAKLIRDYRLKAKEAVKRATTIEEIDTSMETWNVFVVNIRTQLGVG